MGCTILFLDLSSFVEPKEESKDMISTDKVIHVMLSIMLNSTNLLEIKKFATESVQLTAYVTSDLNFTRGLPISTLVQAALNMPLGSSFKSH